MDSLTATDIAAFIGAAAWLPQIATWIYRGYITSQITILPAQQAEIGYTRFGPIFNVRLAFSANRKDAVIDKFEVCLRHQEGEERRLRWVGMTEHMSEIIDQAGNRQVIEKDQVAIAFKITTATLLEKFVRFQEQKFTEAIKTQTNSLVSQVGFLRAKNQNCGDEILGCKEYREFVEAMKRHFWWRKGKYIATFDLSSPKKISLEKRTFSFELSQLDVDFLLQNLLEIEADLENTIKSGEPDYKLKRVNWNWRNIAVSRA